MEKLMRVKQIFETDEIVVVNSLLKSNWLLLGIYRKENKTYFYLGYIPK